MTRYCNHRFRLLSIKNVSLMTWPLIIVITFPLLALDYLFFYLFSYLFPSLPLFIAFSLSQSLSLPIPVFLYFLFLSIYLSIYLSACLFVYLFIHVCVYLFANLSLNLIICLSVSKSNYHSPPAPYQFTSQMGIVPAPQSSYLNWSISSRRF